MSKIRRDRNLCYLLKMPFPFFFAEHKRTYARILSARFTTPKPKCRCQMQPDQSQQREKAICWSTDNDRYQINDDKLGIVFFLSFLWQVKNLERILRLNVSLIVSILNGKKNLKLTSANVNVSVTLILEKEINKRSNLEVYFREITSVREEVTPSPIWRLTM